MILYRRRLHIWPRGGARVGERSMLLISPERNAERF